ncbi:MAG: hypothetical protein LBN30_03330 [Oscillospiraceae bacterium]|jgi:hypothetical protein|nr:hypothetical protein [Oscillospiraceae bacterium]
MPEYEVELFFSNIGERNAVRMRVVDKLSKEFPGAGKEELASRYKYFVEKLSDGKRIYLRRPAYLHNGFDFVVHVEGVNFNPNGKRRSNPSHEDIITDLKIKFLENQILYNKLFSLCAAFLLVNWNLKMRLWIILISKAAFRAT